MLTSDHFLFWGARGGNWKPITHRGLRVIFISCVTLPLPRPAHADSLSSFPLHGGVSVKAHSVASEGSWKSRIISPGQEKVAVVLSVRGAWLLQYFQVSDHFLGVYSSLWPLLNMLF